nr:unnamed protein product [Digitaria exilis]
MKGRDLTEFTTSSCLAAGGRQLQQRTEERRRRETRGVESYDVDIKEQKVTVKGNVTPDAVLQTVSKTGKKTSFWEAETTSNQSTAPADATA